MSAASRLALAVSFSIALSLIVPAAASAWGYDGHHIIGVVATEHLPAELPGFLQTQSAKNEIVYLQSEEDRLKIGDSEQAWSREWPPDHYLDVDDNGMIGGVVALQSLPATRDDYGQALMNSPKHLDPYNEGFLPYAILEGYEQVRSDFALWREATAALKARPSAANQVEVQYREALTIHDIGIFSHFVGDGSQPLHVTVHYNGWGPYPNPQGFSTDKSTHSEFESDFVSHFLTPALVSPLVGSASVLDDIPLTDIEHYLADTNAQVVPLYKLKQQGGFDLSDSSSAVHAQAVKFTAARLAAAGRMLDSLILTAWQTSATMKDSD